MVKRLSMVGIILIISMGLFGCGADTQQSETQTEVTTEAVSVQNDANTDNYYPVTITCYDSNKKEIELTFHEEPTNVYVMAQSNIEIMLALGLGDNIGLCYGIDDEIDEELQDAFSEVNFLDESFAGLSKEEVIAMQPDLIIGWVSMFADTKIGSTDYWNASGIPTYIALNGGAKPSGAYQTIEDEMQDILNIGKIFNVNEKAEEIVAEMNAEIEKIAQYVESSDKKQVAVLEDEGGTYRVYGVDSLGGSIAMAAGAQLKIGAQDSQNIDKEYLIEQNPDAIFMVWYNEYITAEQAVSDIINDPALASLDAVKNAAVYPVNLVDVYSSGYGTLDSILKFSTALYPELYE